MTLLFNYCSAFSQIPTDSLVAYFPFNGNANDSSGNGFNGTLAGQTQVAGAGSCSGAYSFSGNYINCGDPVGNEFDLVNDASISLWVKFASLPAGYYTLIGKDQGPGNLKKWLLMITGNELRFHINEPPSSVGWIYQSIFNFAVNTFYHIVVTKAGNTYEFYVNGVLYGTQAMPLNIADIPIYLKIGDLQDGSNPLNVAIDEVLIYHKALTQSEVSQLYNCCTGSTGVFEENMLSDLKAYPNPVENEITIRNNTNKSLGEILIYDILGQVVYQKFISEPQEKIDVRNFSAGVFYVRGNSFNAIKFVKQ